MVIWFADSQLFYSTNVMKSVFPNITLHIHVVSPVSWRRLVFFLLASRQPITSTIRSWHNKHAACLLAHYCR